MYTDGVTEAVNPKNQVFGRERLAKLSQQVNNITVTVTVAPDYVIETLLRSKPISKFLKSPLIAKPYSNPS
jgi:serine phosphatase RsbU (regulator of sigma subunit)